MFFVWFGLILAPMHEPLLIGKSVRTSNMENPAVKQLMDEAMRVRPLVCRQKLIYALEEGKLHLGILACRQGILENIGRADETGQKEAERLRDLGLKIETVLTESCRP